MNCAGLLFLSRPIVAANRFPVPFSPLLHCTAIGSQRSENPSMRACLGPWPHSDFSAACASFKTLLGSTGFGVSADITCSGAAASCTSASLPGRCQKSRLGCRRGETAQLPCKSALCAACVQFRCWSGCENLGEWKPVGYPPRCPQRRELIPFISRRPAPSYRVTGAAPDSFPSARGLPEY